MIPDNYEVWPSYDAGVGFAALFIYAGSAVLACYSVAKLMEEYDHVNTDLHKAGSRAILQNTLITTMTSTPSHFIT